jgi:hypothetical protein
VWVSPAFRTVAKSTLARRRTGADDDLAARQRPTTLRLARRPAVNLAGVHAPHSKTRRQRAHPRSRTTTPTVPYRVRKPRGSATSSAGGHIFALRHVVASRVMVETAPAAGGTAPLPTPSRRRPSYNRAVDLHAVTDNSPLFEESRGLRPSECGERTPVPLPGGVVPGSSRWYRVSVLPDVTPQAGRRHEVVLDQLLEPVPGAAQRPAFGAEGP